MPPKKNQKMSLGTFLGDQSLGSWADEMEDMPLPSERKSAFSDDRRGPRGFDPVADKDWSSARRPDYAQREPLPLPTKPPFTAHLGNLSFDVTAGDIEDFLSGCEVTNVRIVEDKLDKRPKGFGYVEFATVDGLKAALDKSGSDFQGRNIRVSVADPPKDRVDNREFNDWTRRGPLPELPGNNRRTSDRGSFRGGFEAASDAGSERGSRRGPPPPDSTRDFGNWERKGPLSPVAQTAPAAREGGRPRVSEKTFERRPSPAWGEGRSQDGGSRPPRPIPERQPTAAEMDTQWRARMKPDAPPSQQPTPEPSAPSSPAAPSATTVPVSRPRLNLQKRTVSSADPAEPPSAASETKSSIFGGARPVDSATREQQVEAKRLALRQKKEDEDKAAAEKKATEKAAKVEKGASTSGAQENGKGDKEADENGATSPSQPGSNFEILRRMTEQEDTIEEGSVTASANGEIMDTADKEVKPKEIVRDPNAPGGPDQNREQTAQELEAEGWSTVPENKKKNRRSMYGGARAVAS